ncbi:MAG: hypothetical protein RID91_02320 [Azospirillaceae bacterium]
MPRPSRARAFLLLAALGLAGGGCSSLHPAEGAAIGAAGGAAYGLVTTTPLILAVPAGALAGGSAVSLVEGYRANKAKCPELKRCVY